MSGTSALPEIAGDAALRLWGTHRVTAGVLRGCLILEHAGLLQNRLVTEAIGRAPENGGNGRHHPTHEGHGTEQAAAVERGEPSEPPW